MDRNAFGEGADAVIARAGVDQVAGLESIDLGADLQHRSGGIVAQDEGGLVGQDGLELAVADLLVELVHSGGQNLHEDIVLAHARLGDLRQLQWFLVLPDNKSFHRLISCENW
ncbi:hypothetical protein D3C74_442950 [compost metagenome]